MFNWALKAVSSQFLVWWFPPAVPLRSTRGSTLGQTGLIDHIKLLSVFVFHCRSTLINLRRRTNVVTFVFPHDAPLVPIMPHSTCSVCSWCHHTPVRSRPIRFLQSLRVDQLVNRFSQVFADVTWTGCFLYISPLSFRANRKSHNQGPLWGM